MTKRGTWNEGDTLDDRHVIGMDSTPQQFWEIRGPYGHPKLILRLTEGQWGPLPLTLI